MRKGFIALTFAAAFAMASGAAMCADTKSKPPAPGAKGAPGEKKLSKEQEKIKDDMMSMFNDKLKHRFAPAIKDVKIGAASVGKPIDITVTAAPVAGSIDKIVSASVYYSMEGGSRILGPVNLKAAGPNVFKGQIPPIKRKGKMYVMPAVKDAYGNVGLELSCPVKSWPPFEDPCMPPGAVDADPLDDPAAKIEDDFDIWDFRFGMDDKYYYLMSEVEGEISKGTVNPMHINSYLSLLVDNTVLGEFKNVADIMAPDASEKFKDKAKYVNMIFYAPLAPSIDPKFKSCFIPKMDQAAKAQADAQKKQAPAGKDKAAPPAPGKTPDGKAAQQTDVSKFLDTEHIKCKKDESALYFRMDKSVFPQNMWKSLSVIGSINGYIENMQMPLPKLRELLPVTRVNWNPRVVNVK